ncbi:MAG: type II toxin-antitoxin system RelE/ParE family toxin [Candidatus Pacebacteria bacterium]|jgi:phage-related protein|nr:type II toxin-antitoxin system RelE/ParE family toxin [Candidatus Paceibacterota bacterium]MBT3512040.1 type II toxin-antitoxin system RelE/ParE family toxin [Candidatus Paceibacterota bacterium]MBT4004470.1 type II toxin-antitoxin system RelE/ParE family toxin [Candidatus Paceibacterota bacterium]MBT4359071.1 type II toxin-antitoxin system RelE/ParE family toxin [Candidatus Paceibacterota bacterium]MBT4681366.1 type II toxin-antitoxin system RelE/ParE family toxin [Candidatus Paceibacterota
MEIIVSLSVEDFIDKLQPKTIAKVLRTTDLLEKFGYQLSMPHSRKIKDNLFELRVRGKQEVRIFYCFSSGKIILIHGFIKKKQKISNREIRKALKVLCHT